MSSPVLAQLPSGNGKLRIDVDCLRSFVFCHGKCDANLLALRLLSRNDSCPSLLDGDRCATFTLSGPHPTRLTRGTLASPRLHHRLIAGVFDIVKDESVDGSDQHVREMRQRWSPLCPYATHLDVSRPVKHRLV